MAIAVRIVNPLKPVLPIDPSLGSLTLEHPPSNGLTNVATSFLADGTAMTTSAVLQEGDIAAPLLLTPDSHDPDYVDRQLQSAFSSLQTISQYSLELVIQELRLHDPPARFSGLRAWSLDGGPWRDLPVGLFMTGVQLLPTYRLDAAWGRHLQHLIAGGERPFTATLHLQEAQAHRGTRFRWIQATTAAELAIKEALLRLEPRLQVLLMDVPSPPIHKLFGSVLEKVCGVRSPFVKELQKGAEVRNNLVHRTDEPDPDLQETVNYIATVDPAIRHLRFLCRSKDSKIALSQLHPHVRFDEPDRRKATTPPGSTK